MRYAKIRKMDVSNGEGIGVALFVQGCHFHCKGCFNQETWDFDGGMPWDEAANDAFMKAIDKPYVQRVSILGGEPMCDENVEEVYGLVLQIRKMFPDKKIWLYTGYDFDRICTLGVNPGLGTAPWKKRAELAMSVDVLVDGQFELDKQDLFNEHIVFAGSTNQRVIRISDLPPEERCAD